MMTANIWVLKEREKKETVRSNFSHKTPAAQNHIKKNKSRHAYVDQYTQIFMRIVLQKKKELSIPWRELPE